MRQIEQEKNQFHYTIKPAIDAPFYLKFLEMLCNINHSKFQFHFTLRLEIHALDNHYEAPS